jgi:hypothetical protein
VSQDQPGPHYARHAAMVVAVMAAFLAVATFLANEAVKEVITGETHRADESGQLETNRVKIEVNEGDSTLLEVLGQGAEGERKAAAEARAQEQRVVGELEPTDERLREEISEHEGEINDANNSHIEFELAEVALEVGIVLASVSIIARRRWLLGAGGAAASAGVILVVVGLLV